MANFPNNGGNSPALNGGLELYFSQYGSTSNDGRTWQTANKWGYDTYAKLAAAGGGILHFIDGASWGGPVANQGPWFRGDGRNIPGWQPAVSCKIIGTGGQKTQFGLPAARLVGGANYTQDRFHPLVWFVSNSVKSVIFENIVPAGSANDCAQNGRFGWDYRRKESDDTIALANITNWNRSAGSAVVTVALPETVAITSASRTSNVTTIHFAAQKVQNASPDQWIVITSTDGNFSSGAKQVISCTTTSLTYAETASNNTGTTIGTWATHGVKQYDRIEVVSTDPEVVTTMYRVSATTATTITVTDPYGYAPRTASKSVNNPGQYVLQDRCNYIAGLFDVINLSGACSPSVGVDTFIAGPNLDFGGTTDGRINVRFGSSIGYRPVSEDAKDPDRGCWMLLDGGSRSAAGLTVNDQRNGQTGIRAYGSKVAGWLIDARRVNSDADIFGRGSPPALEVIEGGIGADVFCDSVFVWDNPANAPNVKSDAPFYSHNIINCGTVQLNGNVTSTNWSNLTESAYVRHQTGLWNGRVSADSPQARRAFAARTARYQNWVQDVPATWTIAGGGTDVTTSVIPGPQGLLTDAIHAVRAAGNTGVFLLPADANNNPHTGSPVVHAVGDSWVMGGWFRKADWGGAGTPVASFSFAGANGNFNISLTNTFRGDGEWQWIAGAGTITAISDSAAGWRAVLNCFAGEVGQTIDVGGLFLTRIPNGDMTANEVAEYAATLQATEYYLPAGMTGTWKGQKFIGHGGFGTNSANAKTVGVGSGQLTLTGSGTVYLPTYATDGVTFIGWTAQLQATVNP